MLLHASKVLLAMCLLYVGHGMTLYQKVESTQQQSMTSNAGGSYNPIIVTCKDGKYTRQKILEALKRGSEMLQNYLNTGNLSEDLIEYSAGQSDVHAFERPFFATSIIYPNDNRRKAMIVFNKLGSLVTVVTQTKIIRVRDGPRIEYVYEPCSVVQIEGL